MDSAIPPAPDLSRLYDREPVVTQVLRVLGFIHKQGAFGEEVFLHDLGAYKRLNLKSGLKTMFHPQGGQVLCLHSSSSSCCGLPGHFSR